MKFLRALALLLAFTLPSQAALTYRTTGDWGTGKGAPLTWAELDTNLWELSRGVYPVSAPAAITDHGNAATTGSLAWTIAQAPAGSTIILTAPLPYTTRIAVTKNVRIRATGGGGLTTTTKVSGTTTGTTSSHLIDSGATFATVQVGDVVRCTTAARLNIATVTVVSAGNLTLDKNIFTTGDTYEIYPSALYFSAGTDVDVEGLAFSGGGAAVNGRLLTAGADVRVVGCTFSDVAAALWLRAPSQIELGTIRFQDNTVDGAFYGVFDRLFGHTAMLVSGNSFNDIQNCAVRDGHSTDTTTTLEGFVATGNRITNVLNTNELADEGEAHAFLTYGPYAVIDGNYINSVNSMGAGQSLIATAADTEAIHMRGSGGIVSNNVVINGSKREGAICSKDGGDRWVVTGNLIIDTRDLAAPVYGIFTTRDQVLIESNVIIGMGAAGRGIHTYNETAASNIAIRGNKIWDCNTGIQVNSLGTSLVIEDNIIHGGTYGSVGIILGNGYNLSATYLAISGNRVYDHTSTAISVKDISVDLLEIRGNTIASSTSDTVPTLGVSVTGLKIQDFTHAGETAVGGGAAAPGDFVKGATSGAYGTVRSVTGTTLQLINATGTWAVGGERIDRTTTLNGAIANPGWYVTVTDGGTGAQSIAQAVIDSNVISGVKTTSGGAAIFVSPTVSTLGHIAIRGNTTNGGQYAVKTSGTITHLDVSGNDMTGFSGASALSNTATATTSRISLAEAEGAAASVSDGGTIPHGLGVAPAVATVSGSIANELVAVTGVDATNITVSIKKRGDGTAGTAQTIYWRATVQ